MVKGIQKSIDSESVWIIPCNAAFIMLICGISIKRALSPFLLDIPAENVSTLIAEVSKKAPNGLAASFMTAYKFYLSVSEKEKKQETKDRAFNQHR